MGVTGFKLLLRIFTTFVKISPVTFGGGYALIPVIEREAVENRKWVKTDEMTDIITVAQTVPGAIAVNAAALIGFRLAKWPGALAALLGIMLPTFCFVVLLSVFYLQMKDHPKVEAAFTAIRATVVALIVYAACKTGKNSIIDPTTAVITLITVALLYFCGDIIHPVLLIVGGAVAGLAAVSIRKLLGLKAVQEKKEEVYDYMI